MANVPEWLRKLPPGKYTLKQVADRFKITKVTVCQRFKRLEIKPEYVSINKSIVAVYEWKGADGYSENSDKKTS